MDYSKKNKSKLSENLQKLNITTSKTENIFSDPINGLSNSFLVEIEKGRKAYRYDVSIKDKYNFLITKNTDE